MEGQRIVNERPAELKLNNLELLSRVGEGGMSTVWKARDLTTGEIVAVKLLSHESAANREDIVAFWEEELLLEKCRHQGIVRAYRLHQEGGLWYFVMEYVEGYNFGDLLRRKQHVSEADCLLICESVAVALDYAWNEHGIVHCDIKPENIMINSDGIVKLTDLGISHRFRNSAPAAIAVSDHVLGTPAYISPEQVFGDVELDCRADIYSLAATLYHLSTGRVLFPDLSTENAMRAHCSPCQQAADPRTYRPLISEGFCQLLEAMLVKDRDERVSNWSAVFQMCQEIESGVKFKPRASTSPSSIVLL